MISFFLKMSNKSHGFKINFNALNASANYVEVRGLTVVKHNHMCPIFACRPVWC